MIMEGEEGSAPLPGFYLCQTQDPLETSHNKEARALLAVKKSEVIIEKQAIGTAYVPTHKFKENFFEYYEDNVKKNKREDNRHLQSSLKTSVYL